MSVLGRLYPDWVNPDPLLPCSIIIKISAINDQITDYVGLDECYPQNDSEKKAAKEAFVKLLLKVSIISL